MRIYLTKQSTNRKTGPIPVSTSEETTCPDTCPWYDQGCYADAGPLRLHWKKVSSGERASTFTEFLQQIRMLPLGQLWRHNQAGDLPGSNQKINQRMLQRLVKASFQKYGFTYTHKPVTGRSKIAILNRKIIKKYNSQHFTINLSADGINHADQLIKLKIAPVTTILPSNETRTSFYSPAGNKVTVCPATYSKEQLATDTPYSEEMNCMTCKLCSVYDRKTIIGFPAHGTQKKYVNTTLKVLNE